MITTIVSDFKLHSCEFQLCFQPCFLQFLLHNLSSHQHFKHSITNDLFMMRSLGGCSTLPTEGGAVDSHPETNVWLQLSIRGDHDRRPAQPANRATAIRPGCYLFIDLSIYSV